MDTVRIEDLAAPEFSPEVREIFDLYGRHGGDLTFEPDALMAAATEQTGLSDFGDAGFREPLGVLCRASVAGCRAAGVRTSGGGGRAGRACGPA